MPSQPVCETARLVNRVRDENTGDDFAAWSLELHGHEMIYRTAGSGPPLVVVHGMVNSSKHWRDVALRLAETHTVIVPDLIGHGDSAAVRGDYSIGAHAAVIRDLLSAIGVESASFVGHSLGGGIAMQFFYQFPHRVERLALVSSGGLGQEVSPLLRGAALPGASGVVWAASHRGVLGALDAVAAALGSLGWRKAVYLKAITRAVRPLQVAGARRAFLESLRAVIDIRGQKVSALDRLYLLGPVPTMIVWGERDRTIPIEHGREAHSRIPHSRFETLPRAAHFPNLEDPASLANTIAGWLAETTPYRLSEEEWSELIASRLVRGRHLRAA
ncbi:alpha/beta fold hydrolase [soil metagenome]